MDTHHLTAHELIDFIKAKKTTPAEIYDSIRGQIAKSEKKVKAYVRLNENDFKNNSFISHLRLRQ